MLKIFNSLKPFFEDCYRRINVREYARLRRISPPTASKLLQAYRREGLLKKEQERIYDYYFANKDSQLFMGLGRLYWRSVLEKAGLLAFFQNEFLSPLIILFGSLSKAETKPGSDIDIAVFTPTKKEIDVSKFEKKLKRKIQLFVFKDRDDVKNPELLNNMLNGYKLSGVW